MFRNHCVINRQNDKRTDLRPHQQTATCTDCEVYINQQTTTNKRTKDSNKKVRYMHVRLGWCITSDILLYKASDTVTPPNCNFSCLSGRARNNTSNVLT